jgi:hypothetical protein
MSSANGKAPPDALEELDEVIRELEGSAWDEISEVTENHIHIHPPKGSVVETDATGRMRAISVPDGDDSTPTKPDHPAPKSGWPERVSRALVPLLGGLPPWGRVVVLLALIAVLALSVWRGGAGAGLWG